jgi:NAD(P)H-hydrate epimerase
MKSYTVQAMRELDRRTVAEGFATGIGLMEQAGYGLFRAVMRFSQHFFMPDFLLLAGKGNNGGDVFVLARHMAEAGVRFRLCMSCAPEELSGDAAEAFHRMPETEILRELRSGDLYSGTIVVDGLLGTGATGAPRSPIDRWIRLVNRSGCPVIAVDIPSGMNGTDGSAELCIRADLTVTMAGVKQGMILNPAPCGRLEVVKIGIPEAYLEEAGGLLELFGAEDIRKYLKREAFDTYKNRRGHLLIAGGSPEYPSAPFLSGEAALYCGAGLVTVTVPEKTDICSAVPKALIVRKGFSSELLKGKQALAVGPGMGTSQAAAELLKELLKAGLPTVLDADALNLIAQDPQLLEYAPAETILTPHAGELARLCAGFGIAGEDARKLAMLTGCTVLAKSPRTLVISPDGDCSINLSGTPALATAGSGDVLTGICGTLLANGLNAFDAARCGAFLHGATGEFLMPHGSYGIIADDLAKAVGKVRQQYLQ